MWRPLDPSEYRALRPFQRAIYRFYRSAAGPLGYYLCEIWWKKMFFPRSSDIGGYSLAYVRDLSIVVAGLALAITLAVDRSATNGALAGSLTMGLIVPFLVFNVLMSLVIYLHHTHPSVRWFGDERDWKAHTAQLDCTIHIVFPGPINVLFHRIMEHQAHHVQATIPLYRLQRAQETLARQHGSRVRQVRWTVREHLATVSACKLYDYQRHRWLDYEGAPTTGSSLSDAAPERSADESRAALTVSIAIFALLLPWGASAQGLALRGVGPVNRAMGGVATASIGGLPASEIRLGLELLDPETRVSSEIAPFALGPVPTATLAGSTRGRGGPIPSPSAAIVHRPTGSRWTFGLGVFGIAGVQINYPSSETNPYLRPQTPLPGTAPLPGLGRVVGRASYLQVAPTVSYAITDRLSIGIAPTPTLAQLEAMPDTAGAGFDEVFTPQRLHTQRARIAHRLAQAVGQIEPARVLAFPFSVRPRRPLQLSPARWLAGAAAGLLLGVTAGQLLHYHPAGTGPQLASTDADDDAETTPATRRAAAELAAPSDTLDMTGTVELPPPDGNTALASPITLDDFERLMADEEFLGSLDLALTSFQVSELESIDALTPRVRDLSINIR